MYKSIYHCKPCRTKNKFNSVVTTKNKFNSVVTTKNKFNSVVTTKTVKNNRIIPSDSVQSVQSIQSINNNNFNNTNAVRNAIHNAAHNAIHNVIPNSIRYDPSIPTPKPKPKVIIKEIPKVELASNTRKKPVIGFGQETITIQNKNTCKAACSFGCGTLSDECINYIRDAIDLQRAYENSGYVEIELNNRNRGIDIIDSAKGVFNNLIQVNNNNRTKIHFAVNRKRTCMGNNLKVNETIDVAKNLNIGKKLTTVGDVITGCNVIIKKHAIIERDLTVKRDAIFSIDGIVKRDLTVCRNLLVKNNPLICGNATIDVLTVNRNQLIRGDSLVCGVLELEQDIIVPIFCANTFAFTENSSNPFPLTSGKSNLWMNDSDQLIITNQFNIDTIFNFVPMQDAYNNSTNGIIITDNTRGGIIIQDAAISLGMNIFEIQDNAASSTFFSVDSSIVTIDGKLTVTGLIDPTGVVIEDQPANPNPAITVAGEGVYWVKDTSPNIPIFSDDVGFDTNLIQTIQNIYDNTFEIVVDSIRGPIAIKDNSIPLGANLFEIQDNIGTFTFFSVDAIGAAIDGKLTVTGLIDPTGIVYDEQSASPSVPTIAKGTIWVRDDVPNRCIFTDDIGTDYIIGGTAFNPTYNNLTVNGTLLINGIVAAINSETLSVADNFICLNKGYDANPAQTGGIVINCDPDTGSQVTVTGAFTAGTVAILNPRVVTSASGVFSDGDFVIITGANSVENNGIYEVLDHTTTTLIIRGVGITGNTVGVDYVQNQFTTDAAAGGTITKTKIIVLRGRTDGELETFSGSNSSGLIIKRLLGSDIFAFAFANDTLLTGSGTDCIIHETNLIYDNTDLSLFKPTNDGNPKFVIGSSVTECAEIELLYETGTQDLDRAIFRTKTTSGTTDRGKFSFMVDNITKMDIIDGGTELLGYAEMLNITMPIAPSLTDRGRLYAKNASDDIFWLHNGASEVNLVQDIVIASGTYTPTFTTITNFAPISLPEISSFSVNRGIFVRIGNVVNVRILFDVNFAAAGLVELRFDLPASHQPDNVLVGLFQSTWSEGGLGLYRLRIGGGANPTHIGVIPFSGSKLGLMQIQNTIVGQLSSAFINFRYIINN